MRVSENEFCLACKTAYRAAKPLLWTVNIIPQLQVNVSFAAHWSGQPQWAPRASSELTGCEVTGLISESSLHSGWEYWSRSEELAEVALSTLLMINAEQQVIEQIEM